ncbi:MAG: hypothetical protein K0R92_171 [Lachnospiraceae bacterium]|jgi:V/A-type H+-transporting ATPase subunit I|nr:hypothetical protein [Lachnospiraceae bacterium]
MAVLQMQRISITGLKKDRKQVLELIQRRGVIEIADSIEEDSVFQKRDASAAKSVLEKNTAAAREALEILESYAEEKKGLLDMLNGREELATEDYNAFSPKHDEVLRIAKRIVMLAKEIAENNAEILRLGTQIEMLSPWISLDIPMNFKGTKYTSSFIGVLPQSWTLESIYEKLAEQTPLNVDVISTSEEQTCVFILCARDNADSVSEVLRSMGFSHPNTIYEKAPKEQLEALETLIEQSNSEIKTAKDEIISYQKDRNDIRFLHDYDSMRAEKYEVISRLLQSKKVFVLTGYIPEIESQSLSKDLNQRFDIAVEFENPSEEDDVPVILHNNGFSSPLEGIIESYSLPGKTDIDPTTAMSFFYYFLFGLMLSDAGYGAIITGACAFGLIKFKGKLEYSMKQTLKMYLFGGISTIFWGVMFGSYFGNIVDAVSGTFFGNTLTIPPLWFFPVNQPMRMLAFSMLIGIIHLITGLFLKFYMSIKQKEYAVAFFDVLFWIIIVLSSIVVAVSTDMVKDLLGLTFEIPAIISSVAGYLAIASAIGIILTNGRDSKNPVLRVFKGLYALYGITSYLSDILSYSRLLALGLATGIIATVINQMASMVGGGFGIIGIVLFIVIEIFGHSLNLAINALGTYVHTNRLQYVEFFGKFFEGGGRMFKPFMGHTKYYKFEEKTNNG